MSYLSDYFYKSQVLGSAVGNTLQLTLSTNEGLQIASYVIACLGFLSFLLSAFSASVLHRHVTFTIEQQRRRNKENKHQCSNNESPSAPQQDMDNHDRDYSYIRRMCMLVEGMYSLHSLSPAFRTLTYALNLEWFRPLKNVSYLLVVLSYACIMLGRAFEPFLLFWIEDALDNEGVGIEGSPFIFGGLNAIQLFGLYQLLHEGKVAGILETMEKGSADGVEMKKRRRGWWKERVMMILEALGSLHQDIVGSLFIFEDTWISCLFMEHDFD